MKNPLDERLRAVLAEDAAQDVANLADLLVQQVEEFVPRQSGLTVGNLVTPRSPAFGPPSTHNRKVKKTVDSRWLAAGREKRADKAINLPVPLQIDDDGHSNRLKCR